ncbi:diphosphomevalonate decarboxylase [Boothiomyces sp. JEL0838]|nr:diphosphomevalonate decarboxylase [Boothiomyces sp. JEL0838]
MTSPNKKQRITKSKEVTCSAPVNIAVIKYWGKRNTALLLPTNSSLSLTLNQDDLRSTTTIRASPDFVSDRIWLNGKEENINAKRLSNVLSKAKELRKEMEEKDADLEKLSEWGIYIASYNNFPTAAGLASSASGFACLTFALSQIYDLPINLSQVSMLARLGSGSACRSLFGGFVKWEMGTKDDGSDSLAIQVASETDWPGMEALILVVSDARKDTGSTEGMQLTVETSELLKHRIEKVVPQRMLDMEKAIAEKDFDSFAEITMADSNQFHAVCLDSYPPIFYLNDISKAVIKVITALNAQSIHTDASGKKKGYKVAYTFDAGPNAVLYMQKEHLSEVLGVIDYLFPRKSTQKVGEYYGKAKEVLENVDKTNVAKVCDGLGLKQWPKGSLTRIISTSVGDGPRVLSKEYDSEASLLTIDDVAKQI